MTKSMQLAARMGLALGMTMLVGTSAFADSRPAKETRARRDAGGAIRREVPAERSTAARGDESTNRSRGGRDEAIRSESRVQVRGDRQERSASTRDDRSIVRDRDRSIVRDRDRSIVGNRDAGRIEDRGRTTTQGRGTYDSRDRDANRSGRDGTWRGDSRSGQSSTRGRTGSYRQPHYASGRVSRVLRHGSGYRVWVHGTNYPFFIPMSHWHRDRFRVGLVINLGGYYNPLGYYDYYDGRSRGDLRGVVESVDYRRDTFVVRNDYTGSFVTVYARERYLDVRPGDYVEISGEWTRSGLFTAWDVDLLDRGSRY